MRCKRNALLEVNHCGAQRQYVEWKFAQLASLVRTPPKLRSGNGGRVAFRFTTRSLNVLTPYFRMFYSGGCKRIPAGLQLPPLALAVWFMDDGCRSRSSVYLNTQQFDFESQRIMLSLLQEQHGISGTLNRDKIYYRIRIAVRSMRTFSDLVRPHLIPEMRYKLPS